MALRLNVVRRCLWVRASFQTLRSVHHHCVGGLRQENDSFVRERLEYKLSLKKWRKELAVPQKEQAVKVDHTSQDSTEAAEDNHVGRSGTPDLESAKLATDTSTDRVDSVYRQLLRDTHKKAKLEARVYSIEQTRARAELVGQDQAKKADDLLQASSTFLNSDCSDDELLAELEERLGNSVSFDQPLGKFDLSSIVPKRG